MRVRGLCVRLSRVAKTGCDDDDDDDDDDGGDGVDRQLVRMGYRFLVRGCKGL